MACVRVRRAVPLGRSPLHDVIASKEAANRTKDHAMLPHLYALEDELAAGERGEGPTG